jgi:transcription elongation factor SPT5
MADLLSNHDMDDESEDDFNPAPAVDSDNDDDKPQRGNGDVEGARRRAQEDTYEDEDDEVDAPRSKSKSSRQGSRAPNDDDEDGEGDEDEEDFGKADDIDDDEEEEEEDEEEEAVGRARKRHKRDRRLHFIDVEAEVDDEEEEDDIEDDELPDETHPDDLLDMPAGPEDDRRHRELDRQREIAASLDAEQQAAALREKYGRRTTTMPQVSAAPRHMMLPGIESPRIWSVRVKPGKEAEIANQIMKRYFERMRGREPLKITAAFGRGGTTMAGYVYVEARQEADIMAATEDISFCYPRSFCKMISLQEMPDLLHTLPPNPIEEGQWVRIKRPAKYAGDLAQVTIADSNGSDVTVKIIPRVDYGNDEDMNGPQAAKRKRPGFGNTGPRPPQRLFNDQEARKKQGRFLQQQSTLSRKHFTFHGDEYVDGFLHKDMKISAIQTEDVNPTLEEVSKFVGGDETGENNLDLASIAASLKANTTSSDYLPGDKVEIYQGEQQGVRGQAVSVRADIVTIKVTEGDLLGQVIEAPAKGLRKLFREGDHVKVIGGSKYHDEVGMVVRVKDETVTLLTDSNNQEITVFSKDLREASDSSGAQAVSKYDLYDLVQLDATTVACVIKVDRESLRVLDQNGTVRSLLPSNISNKIERRKFAVTADRDGQQVHTDDTVKEYGGEQRQGRVVHIHRNFVFLQDRQRAENAGIFVSRGPNVQSIAAKGGRVNAGPDLTKMNPATQRNGGNGAAPMGPPKAVIGRDKLIGKTVTIRRGPHKGLLGMVKDTTDDMARVELHAIKKIATVPKDSLAIKDPITGQPISFGGGRGRGGGFGGAGPGRFGGQTPGGSRIPDFSGGSRTPAGAAGGGRTPAWGMQQDSRTPSWQQASASSGGRTPGWSQANSSSRTPAWTGGNDGSRTSYGGDGSRTAYGGRTEYGGGANVSGLVD